MIMFRRRKALCTGQSFVSAASAEMVSNSTPCMARCTKSIAAWSYGAVRTTRKPIKSFLFPGWLMPLSADLQFVSKLAQFPPLIPRTHPVAGPTGSVTVPFGYSAFQSQHHSETFPPKSNIPSSFASLCRIGRGLPFEFSSYHATPSI